MRPDKEAIIGSVNGRTDSNALSRSEARTYNNRLRIVAGLTDYLHNGDNIPGQRNDSPESISVLFGNTLELSSIKSSLITKDNKSFYNVIWSERPQCIFAVERLIFQRKLRIVKRMV